jgi:hypothetical protein
MRDELMRMAMLFLLGLLSGCDGVSKSDISNAIKMCEGHQGLEKVVPSHSADSVDIYCNSGAQFTGVAKIKEVSNCQTIMDKQYCN